MKVCFVCPDYPPGPHGGTGTATQALAHALAGRGHVVKVVGVYSMSYPAPDYEDDQGVRVWRLRDPGRRLSWVAGRHALFKMLAAWSRSGEIDLIEIPDWEGWAAFWPRLPVPVIVRLHGSASYFALEMGDPVPPSLFLLERASLRRADFWCSVSRYAARRTQELFGLNGEGGAILYNPVDSPATPAAGPRSRHEVVFTGTLALKKGIVALLRAWPRVLRDWPEAKLHVFGKDVEGDPRGLTRSLLSSRLDLKTAASVRFHGHVDRARVFEVLQRARLAVFPSYSEGFGLAPFEAMSCGCPTIFTRRSCGPELAEDGLDSLLIDPDDPDEIARSILRLLRDDDLSRRLGEAGRKRTVERFSIDRLLPLNESFYRSCLEAFVRQGPGRAPQDPVAARPA